MLDRGYQEDIQRLDEQGYAVPLPPTAIPTTPAIQDFAVSPARPATPDIQDFAVTPAAPQIDVAAYLAANPDIADRYATSPSDRADYGTLDDFAAAHYRTTGQNEIAQGLRSPVAMAPSKSGRVVDPYIPNQPAVVDPFNTDPSTRPKQHGEASQIVPPNTLSPTDPNFTVANQPTPDFGVYTTSATGGAYKPPQLQAPTDKFTTPYYAAYTNDGDLAGAVMVAPGQAIRLVDSKTGEVVFQGNGPEAAQQAVGIANAVSDTRGRHAAWAIQADYGGDKGWVSQAAERWDPKKTGLIGTLADIALPIIGSLVAGPWGAAAGSALSSIAQGRSLKQTALGAALSGAGAYVAPQVSGAVSGALAPAAQVAAQGAIQAGTQAAVQVGAQAAAQGAGTLLTEVVINGVRTLVPAAVAAGLGASVGSVAGGALSSGGGSGSGQNNIQGGAGTDTLATPYVPPPNSVEELVVNGVKQGLTVQQLVAAGLPLAVINSVMAQMGAGTPVDDFVVKGDPKPPTNDIAPPVVLPPPTDLPTDLTPQLPATPVTPTDPAVAGSAIGALTAAVASGDPTKVTDWIKAHPLEAAGLGLTVAGAIAGGGSGGGGTYGVPTGPNGPGTHGSLSPLYTASLPPPTGGPGGFGVRTPRPVNIDQRYAIEHPEASFFNQVPQNTGPASFAVPSPSDQRLAGIGDLNNDGVVDALDLAVWRKRFGGRGYAKGGLVEDDQSANYNTLLAPDQEKRFRVWQKANPKLGNTYDYDARGFWLHGAKTGDRGHGSDKWKKPNHPTFSDQSDWVTPYTPPGHWSGNDYTPNFDNPHAPSEDDLRVYWDREETPNGGKLKLEHGGHVRGPGSGRSDSIDAKLSNNEYVIDAESVAMLGDGSPEAGAKKLDDLRVNLRKHKGRNLAKGKISPSARDPHAYMEGR